MKKYLRPLIFILGLITFTSSYGFDLNCNKCSTFVEIGPKQSIYLEKRGNRGPVIVFDAGLGFGVSTWEKIIPTISQFAQTITYDRIGVGKSSQSKESVSHYLASDSVEKLRTALKNLGIPKPYILVGHSLGGLFMQYYARNFPSEVSGLVLVDSATPNEPRINSPFKPANPTPQEFKDGYLKSLDQVDHSPPLQDIPLIVLTADKHTDNWPYEKQWLSLQTEIAQSSKKGRQVIAKGSGHFIHEDQPQVIIDVIRSLALSIK